MAELELLDVLSVNHVLLMGLLNLQRATAVLLDAAEAGMLLAQI